jgi:hypothetical protein
MPSSVIRAFHYDRAQRRLEVRFVSGRRYAYFDVPPEDFEGMSRSFSKGEYFNAHIRDQYRCERQEFDA